MVTADVRGGARGPHAPGGTALKLATIATGNSTGPRRDRDDDGVAFPRRAASRGMVRCKLAALALATVLVVGFPTTASAQTVTPVAPPQMPVAADAVYETVPIELQPGSAHID